MFLKSSKKVSNRLSAFRTGLKDLKNLTNLSLTFRYFLFKLSSHFVRRCRGVPLRFKPKFKNPGASRLITNSKLIFLITNDVFLNRRTKVSDSILSALGAGLKDMKSLTNLSLDFEYF